MQKEIITAFRNGKVATAYSDIEKYLQNHDSPLLKLYKANILEFKAQFAESLMVLEEVEACPQYEDSIELALGTTITRAYIQWRTGNHEDSKRLLNKSFQLIGDVNAEASDTLQEICGRQLNLQGIHYWYKGDLNAGLRELERARKIFIAIDHHLYCTFSNYNIGLIYWSKGKLDISFHIIEKTLLSFRSMGQDQFIGNALMLLGNISLNQGKNKQVFHYYQKALEIAKQQDNPHDTALALNNLGALYSRSGELELSLQFHQQSYKITRELGNEVEIARSLFNIGTLKSRMGLYEEALDFLLKALKIRKKDRNEIELTNILFQLVLIHCNLGEFQNARNTLEELEEIKNHHPNARIELNSKLAEAIYLKNQRKLSKKAKAMEILEELSNQEIIDFELTTLAILHLCDVLILEYKISPSEVLYDRIKQLITQLVEIAETWNNHNMVFDIKILQIKLAYADYDIQLVHKHIWEAQVISEKLSSFHQNIRFWSDIDDILKTEEGSQTPLTPNADDLLISIRKLIARKSDVIETFDEETPMAVIILDNDMNPLYSKINSVYQHLETEINRILSQLTEKIQMLDNHRYDSKVHQVTTVELSVVARKLENLIFCYVFEGSLFPAVEKLNFLLEMIQVLGLSYIAIPSSSIVGKNQPFSIEIDKLIFPMFGETSFLNFSFNEILYTSKQIIQDIKDFEILLNPLRLSIVQLLNLYHSLKRVELQKILNIKSGSLEAQLKKLMNAEIIDPEYVIFEDRPERVYFITEKGISLYENFKTTLKDL